MSSGNWESFTVGVKMNPGVKRTTGTLYLLLVVEGGMYQQDLVQYISPLILKVIRRHQYTVVLLLKVVFSEKQ